MIQRRTAGINNGTPDAFGAVEHSYKRPAVFRGINVIFEQLAYRCSNSR